MRSQPFRPVATLTSIAWSSAVALVVARLWTEVPSGPRYVVRPVFVLASRGTSSACEAFAYHLQALGRVTVVGDTTGGGAHRVRGVDLGENLTMMLPYTRVTNAVTRTDWEGTGDPGRGYPVRAGARRRAPGRPAGNTPLKLRPGLDWPIRLTADR
jgi:hypothetical protein